MRSKGTSRLFFSVFYTLSEQHNQVTENVVVLIQNVHLYK